jgi:hypothetical protein
LLADEAFQFTISEELRRVINDPVKQFQRLLIRPELFKIPAAHKRSVEWQVAGGK